MTAIPFMVRCIALEGQRLSLEITQLIHICRIHQQARAALILLRLGYVLIRLVEGLGTG